MSSQFAEKSDHPKLVLPAPVTEELSCKMMQKLTGACVSTIAYCRNLFDESDFLVRSMGGVNIRILNKSNNDSPGVQCLLTWLEGVFDAIEKKFLKTMLFDIKNCQGHLLERYLFHYSYENSEMRCALEAGEKSHTPKPLEVFGTTRHDIIGMLRNILVATSAQNSIPPRSLTSVTLHYYDEVTPEKYEPVGFKRHHGEIADFVNPVMKWRCGKVVTGFHSLIVKTKQNKEMKLDVDLDTSQKGIQCPCGLQDTTGNLLKCENCDTLQHSACFKIFSEGNSQPLSHKCMKCSGLESTDSFDSAECVFRRILSLCTKSKSISIKKLTSELRLDPASAMLNIKRLQRENVLPKLLKPVSVEHLDCPYRINKAELSHIIKSNYCQ